MTEAKAMLGKTQEFNPQKFIEHVFPKSVIDAMATNEVLQLVIFSTFFGIATAAIGGKSNNRCKGTGCICACYSENGGLCNELCPR